MQSSHHILTRPRPKPVISLWDEIHHLQSISISLCQHVKPFCASALCWNDVDEIVVLLLCSTTSFALSSDLLSHSPFRHNDVSGPGHIPPHWFIQLVQLKGKSRNMKLKRSLTLKYLGRTNSSMCFFKFLRNENYYIHGIKLHVPTVFVMNWWIYEISWIQFGSHPCYCPAARTITQRHVQKLII